MNILPISVYRVLYKDPDCVMLEPSSKNEISTYTPEKINVLGSCNLFVVHPDTKCFKKITFQVVNHEGSVIVNCVNCVNCVLIVNCVTGLGLGVIQLHSVFNESVPDCGR